MRALSLLKFLSISIGEIDDAIQLDESRSSDDSLADSLTDALQFHLFLSANNATIIFYVSGYLARSVVRATKCEHYREYLVATETMEPLDIDDKLDYSASTFLDAVYHGGLSKPTDFTFSFAMH